MLPPDRYINAAYAASLLKETTERVRRAVLRGQLRGYVTETGRFFIDRAHVAEILRAREDAREEQT